MPSLHNEDGCLARGPYLWKENGEGNLQLGHLRHSQFYHMSRQHIILILGHIPHSFSSLSDLILIYLVIYLASSGLS